jgi:predicted TIM-barrel fold metal-dependent hydrolase
MINSAEASGVLTSTLTTGLTRAINNRAFNNDLLPLRAWIGVVTCEFVGPDRLLYAIDHPWVDPALIASNVESLKFSREEEEKIFSQNARRLFKL